MISFATTLVDTVAFLKTSARSVGPETRTFSFSTSMTRARVKNRVVQGTRPTAIQACNACNARARASPAKTTGKWATTNGAPSAEKATVF